MTPEELQAVQWILAVILMQQHLVVLLVILKSMCQE